MSTSTEWLRKRHEVLETEFVNGQSSTKLYDAVSNSRLYRLPNELRVYIIRLAFGGRTIHTGHIVPDHLLEPVEQHFTEPHNMRWRSCVCARPADRSANDDNCGLFSCEHDSLNDRPTLEPLGIMGFLMSCRLCYFDGVDILYSTNTFHVGCMQVCKDVTLVFPERHMIKIQSLELRLIFHLIDHGDFDVTKNERGFFDLERFLVDILKSCPYLKTLYLSLVEIGNEAAIMEELYPPEEFDILQDALNLVDRIVTQTSPGLNLDLGLPASYYSECKYDRDDEDEKIWRKSEHGGRGFYLSKGEDDDR